MEVGIQAGAELLAAPDAYLAVVTFHVVELRIALAGWILNHALFFQVIEQIFFVRDSMSAKHFTNALHCLGPLDVARPQLIA
jgi:hypothetical protein